MTYKTNRTLFGMLFLVLIFFVLLVVFSVYTLTVLKSEASAFSSLKGGGSIGVVAVNGPILESKKVIELLHDAEKDKTIKAIIVRINSPGGTVGASQEIYEEIRRIDGEYNLSEGKKGLPVYASFGDLAASGGYYIGAAARKIYSNPGTVTGSIGVIANFMNLSELYKWAKIDPEVLKAGRFKDAGSGHRALTDQEKSIFNNLLEDTRKQFIGHILETRKKRLKKDIEEIAQGQVFTGDAAYKIGLVDELAGLWIAGRKIHEELELKGDFGLKFIKKKKKKGLFRFLEQVEGASSRVNQLMDYFFSKISSGPLFFMSSFGNK